MQLVLATHNQDKVAEITALLENLPLKVLTLEDFPQVGPIAETGTTLRENALLKARTVNRITGRPALADDTGLEVEALGGAPGVHSARWAGEGASYRDNVNKLLKEMQSLPPERRQARFRTVAALVDSPREHWTEGVVKGVITTNPRGGDGFGYDPVFLIPGVGKTYAELSAQEKNSHSHRGLALRKLHPILENLIRSVPQ